MRLYILAVLPVLALAGCGDQSRQPPTSTAGPGALGQSPQQTEPESANSLPKGAQVNSPLTPNAGNINDTRVGPATTPVRRPAMRRPSTTGY